MIYCFERKLQEWGGSSGRWLIFVKFKDQSELINILKIWETFWKYGGNSDNLCKNLKIRVKFWKLGWHSENWDDILKIMEKLWKSGRNTENMGEIMKIWAKVQNLGPNSGGYESLPPHLGLLVGKKGPDLIFFQLETDSHMHQNFPPRYH